MELELEFISYNIHDLRSMVYISARYTYQWIGFIADLFYLGSWLHHLIINILALLCCIVGFSSRDLDTVAILRSFILRRS